MTVLYYFFGGLCALAFLAPFVRLPAKVTAQWAFLTLAIMVSIYFGAHLVTSALPRILLEGLVMFAFLAVGFWAKKKWNYGLAVVIAAHGAYDFFMGHGSGVAEWYPPLCAGFDLTAALCLWVIFSRNKAVAAH